MFSRLTTKVRSQIAGASDRSKLIITASRKQDMKQVIDIPFKQYIFKASKPLRP